MKIQFTHLIAFIFVLLGVTSANAECKIDVSDYVGWQIIYAGTVTGYVDEKGVEQDSFEGVL